MSRTDKRIGMAMLGAVAALAWLGGCAAQRPTYFPVAPMRVTPDAHGGTQRDYDLDGDGSADYREMLGSEGRVVAALFGGPDDTAFGQRVDRDAIEAPRRVLIILDSIPFETVRDAYDRGRFRLFYPPTAVLSPFPVMTDMSLNELFGTGPAPGMETEYYDGNNLVDGWGPYRAEANSAWLRYVDYHMPYADHGGAYMNPHAALERELAAIEQLVLERADDTTAYVVSTSALGMKGGRTAHQEALVLLDRFCQALFHRLRGEIEITLMSDHGHALLPAKRLPLDRILRRMGYRRTSALAGPADVVLPSFGLVSCVGLYTQAPAVLARDLIGVEGVALAAYCDAGGEVVTVQRDDDLVARYPEAKARVEQAFGELMQHPPDVLLSLEDGWCWGSAFMNVFLSPQATHGNLGAASSTGFLLTTTGAPPGKLHMGDVADALQRLEAWPQPFAVATD